MICDTCHELQAVALVGNLETGDQTAFCAADLARFGLDFAKRLLPPEEILATLGIPIGGIVDGPASAEPKAAKRSKGKAAAEIKPEPEVTVTGAPEVAATPPDE